VAEGDGEVESGGWGEGGEALAGAGGEGEEEGG